MTSTGPSVSETLLNLLKMRGVDYLFANPGTDFAPIVEALAKGRGPMPAPILAAHENLAIGMAHGYAMATGRAQAVMVHVNVGTANALAGLFNAASAQVPVLLMAGRTPLHEHGVHGARSLNIHWAQEMYDQGGLVRAAVKWDYELRANQDVVAIIERGLAIMRSEPQGPVYLSLPREVLAEDSSAPDIPADPQIQPARGPAPRPEDVALIAERMRKARLPVLITNSIGRDAAAARALDRLAERCALPVIQYRPKYASLRSDHPLHAGFELAPLFPAADLVLVVDCDVPWVPDVMRPAAGAFVVQAGADPLFETYPARGFAAHLSVRADSALFLTALAEAMGAEAPAAANARHDRARAARDAAAERLAPALKGDRMTPAWVSRCIADVCGPDAVLVNEYPLVLDALRQPAPGTFFASTPAGALGWGLPAALGARLALPDRAVVACLGEGSYLFANPVACHHAAAMHGLPLLTVVFNNGEYSAVRRATLGMYPEGAAARVNDMPLVSLEPLPPLHRIVELFDGYGERASDPRELPNAIERCVEQVNDGRQALLEVALA